MFMSLNHSSSTTSKEQSRISWRKPWDNTQTDNSSEAVCSDIGCREIDDFRMKLYCLLGV